MSHVSAHQPPGPAQSWDETASSPNDDLPPDVVEEFTAVAVNEGGYLAVDAVVVLRRDPIVLADSVGIGWAEIAYGREVSVALQADVPGQWMVYAQLSDYEPPVSEEPWAHCPLSVNATTAAWRFFPDLSGPLSLWAYIYVDGRFVPFRSESWSPHHVDDNGAVCRHMLI